VKLSLLVAISLISLHVRAMDVLDVRVKTLGSAFSPGAVTPAEIPGKLTLPVGSKLPAVLLVHGSAGPDARGAFHTDYLAKNGYAVLEIDMWAPRGVTSAAGRPAHPGDTLADIWGAWEFLRGNPRIDKERIAIMGFSWGGMMAVSAAFGLKPRNAPPSLTTANFAAHVAFYPVCDMWIDTSSGARYSNPARQSKSPLQIHNGSKDDYDTAPDVCPRMKARYPNMNIELHVYEGATHGFDGSTATPRTIFDPVAKNFRGGEVTIVGNEQVRERAKENVLRLLNTVLKK